MPDVVVANLGSSANPDINSGDVAASSYANSSWTPPTSGLIPVFVVSEDATVTTLRTPTMSGNGITWVQVGATFDLWPVAQGGTGALGMTLLVANAAGTTTGVTTVSFGAFNQNWCAAAFAHATVVDLSLGPAAAIVQKPPFNGVDPLTEMFASLPQAGSGEIACFWHNADEAVFAPRSGWSVMDDLVGVPAASYAVSTHKPDSGFDTSASADWVTDTRWGGMVIEIKAERLSSGAPRPAVF